MVTIRRAEAGDAVGIARVHVATWQDAYPGLIPDRALLGMSERRHAEAWSHALGGRRGSELVMVAEETHAGVVGFGSCGRQRGTDLPYEGEVYTLYVLTDFRGQGIGRRLLGALFGALAGKGFTSALIWVLARNPARFFYEAMGGARVAVREEKLWGATLPEVGYGWADLKDAVAPLGPYPVSQKRGASSLRDP